MNMINRIFLILLMLVSTVLKRHKFLSSNSFPELRPIAASIGTFKNNLAHFFCHLFSPLVPNDYSCKANNTKLSKIFLVSYDVTSLFTSILLHETIDIAINLIFKHNPNLSITKK